MKKTAQKHILVLTAAALVSSAAFAQDDFGFGFDTPASDTATQSTDGFGDFGDFGGSSGSSGSASPTVTINGTVEANARMYVRKGAPETDAENPDSTVYADSLDDVQKFPTESDPSVSLDLAYSGANTEFEGTLAFSKSILEDTPEDVLEAVTARLYLGNWQFEAGKMKLVWGKGDKLHVLDNFNANDYTDYIIPDYIDRRIAEPAFRAVYSTANGVKIEGVYTPMMTADRLASSGVWKPAKMTTLENSITSIVKSNLAYYAANQSLTEASFAQAYAAYSADPSNTTAQTAFATAKTAYATATENYLTYLSYSNELASDSSSLYPDTQKLKYGQAGLRTTFSIGSVDLGLSYYYGHYKQPTANLKNFIATTVAGDDIKALPEIDYDQLQVFGIEGATILFGSLNSRFELAYNLTKDVAGDDPWVKNNSIAWVAGFDKDLPINEVNINIQTQGSYILNNGKIDDDELTGNATVDAALHAKGIHGAEYDADGIYTNNKIVVAITDSYNHEKIKVDLKGIYGIERKDLIVMPTLTVNPHDDFTLNVSGLVIHSFDKDKSEFAGWLNNDFVEISCKYQF
ncbi:MAG: hypothetical protein K6G80_02135 [Treponema sp.]|nr:hypothetical protein [Treponema sp.]